MHIPDYFLQNASRQFGDDGPGWVQRLPAMLARCLDQWQLTDCVPADKLSINLVCYARSPVYGDIVLKIAGPHAERYTELMALRLYGGRHACTCYASDEQICAMLLERIVPGCDLRQIPDKRTQLEIGAAVIGRLPIPVNETYGLPRYGDWVTKTLATTYQHYHPSNRMIALMSETEVRFHKICPSDKPQYLLHGDLHHENTLLNSEGEWKVIDPQGVIGARFMESARFIQNHIIDQHDVIHWNILDDTVTYFAAQMEESARTVASALFVLHVLSTCWGYEMNYDEVQIARQIDQCQDLLKYANGV